MNGTIRVSEDTHAALEGCKEGGAPSDDLHSRIIAGVGFGVDGLTDLVEVDLV